MSDPTSLSPVTAGLSGRCPRCGEGALFRGFLKFEDRCEACGLDFSSEDAADGPAFFVMSIALFIAVPFAMAIYLATNMSWWLMLLIFIPLLVLICVVLLRPARGLAYALQYKNKALEARFETDEPS